MRTCLSCKKMAPDEAGFCPGCGTQFPVVRAKGGMSAKTAAILVAAICVPLLVACVGIISAIAVPNLLDAIARSRQKRALGEMRSLSTAILEYETGQGTPPLPLSGGSGPWEEVTASQLESALVPQHLKALPANDPWGHPYLYGFNAGEKNFYLLSLGSDGVRQLNAIPEEPLLTHCYESDILLVGGEFVQSPDGKQRGCGEGAVLPESGSGR